MKLVKYHWVTFLQDDEKLQNVREVYLLQDKSIYVRSNDSDGVERRYTYTIAEFEYKFKTNILDNIPVTDKLLL